MRKSRRARKSTGQAQPSPLSEPSLVPWHVLQGRQVAVQVEAELALVAHNQVAWLLADTADGGAVIQSTWATSWG